MDGEKEALSPGARDSVALLEKVLADVKAGIIHSVAIIACGETEWGANMAGPNVQGIYLGIGVLRKKIEEVVTQTVPSNAPVILRPQNSSPIFPPRGPRPVGGRRG